MAQADWTELTGSLSAASLARGVTAGVVPPAGGGAIVYGFNSLAGVTGSAGLYVDLADFNPTASGASITAAIQRGTGSGTTGFSPLIFVCGQGNAVTDTGYLLGLSDAEPARLVLRKGAIGGGIPDLTPDPTVNGNLLATTATYAKGEWVHARLDAIVNDNGDVVLQVFTSDLDVNDVDAPSWSVPAGMEGPLEDVTGFVDDVLQVATGSAPFLSGYAGFAFYVNGSARRGYVDHVTLARQL